MPSSTTGWVAGWNQPGYDPESEPAVFGPDDWDYANDHLQNELDHWAELADMDSYFNQADQCREAVLELSRASLNTEVQVSVSGHGRPYIFWIKQQEAS